MIRRLALILALLSPVAALAQAAGEVLMVPAAFGYADCLALAAPPTYVTMAWTSSQAPVTDDVYRVYVSSNNAACSTVVSTAKKVGGDVTATTTSGTLGGLVRYTFLFDSGASCTSGGATATISVCVQHVNAAGTVKAFMSGSAPLYLAPPPVPVIASVAPGDSALYVSWGAVSGTVPAASYEVNATAYSPINLADEHIQVFTGATNNRVTGLTNGVTYQVTVKSVSPGSNVSIASAEAFGTPAPVSDFWDAYHGAGGREQGGCGGGPAGLVSLLGVALAWRGLRRRP
jgi:hypothetical protein